MNKYGLAVRYKSVYKHNYMKKYLAENAKENLLKGNFSAVKACEKCVTDITYLTYQNKYLYLSTIIDLYSRDIISYVISNRKDVKLVKDTLEKSLENSKDVQGTILHSNQGFQYTSYEYKALCESNGITISMSRKAIPSDNAPIESFHSSLKRETLYSYTITSLEHYKGLVEEWLESYNTTRLKLTA